MISTHVSRASAAFLAVGGLALLFASDDILPRLILGFPPAAAWIGQMLGAAWLAVAALNWLSRSTLVGGIYGRPFVVANVALYFISAMVLLKIVARGGVPASLWLAFVPVVLFAGIYGWLLLRGPIERDFEINRGSQS